MRRGGRWEVWRIRGRHGPVAGSAGEREEGGFGRITGLVAAKAGRVSTSVAHWHVILRGLGF